MAQLPADEAAHLTDAEHARASDQNSFWLGAREMQPDGQNHRRSWPDQQPRHRVPEKFRCALLALYIVDEFGKECLTVKVDRKLNSTSAINALTDRFISHGALPFLHSGNRPKFIAYAVRSRDCNSWYEDGLHRTKRRSRKRLLLEL